MPEHDPLKFASELSAKLATRSRHVCAFLGAGVGRACGLPDVAQLQTRVVSSLKGENSKALARQLQGRSLEQALSRLRRIAALVSGEEPFDDLNSAKATELDRAVCQLIVQELTIKADTDLKPVEYLAAWVARAKYHLPLELFTINYDLLLETALDQRCVPYFDGFVGTMRGRFHTELVEGIAGRDEEWLPPFFTRLWKLHGSVNWAWEEHQIVRLGQSVSESLAAAIYPSDAKYEESRRVPFVVLQDRFRRALHQPESLVIITGYSFGDKHLNELVFDAAARRQRSEFVAFCYSDIPEVLSSQAVRIPNLQAVGGREAILGGVRSPWKVPTSPPPNLWENNQLALRDFRHLAAYLALSSGQQPESPMTISASAAGSAISRSPEPGGNG